MPRSQQMPISNLCLSLQSSHSPCLGLLDKAKQHFLIYPEDQASPSVDKIAMTLGTLVGNQDPALFTRKKRYFIALALSQWLVRLGPTPWLDAPLQHALVFLQAPSKPNDLTFDRPYLRRTLSATPQPSLTEILRNLGICLLELCFGVPLETTIYHKQMSAGLRSSKSRLDNAAAILWSERVGDEAGLDFQNAIEWCLRAHNVDSRSWRKDMAQSVIEPLSLCQIPG